MKNIYIDMDGVVADFVQGVLDIYELDLATTMLSWKPGEYSIEGATGLDWDDIKHEISMHGFPFWKRLKAYPWALKLVELAKNFEVVKFLTCPMPVPGCHFGKMLWVDKKFGMKPNDIVYTCDKHLLANSDSLLIDDRDKNVQSFIHAGGNAVLVPRPWNSAYRFADYAEEYVLTYLDVAVAQSGRAVD